MRTGTLVRGRTRRKRCSLPTAREPSETAAGRSPDARPAGSLAVDLQPPEPREALPCLPSRGRRHVVTAARAGGTGARASVPVTPRGDTALKACVVSTHLFFSQTLDMRTVLRWEPRERHGWMGSEALGVRSASSWSEGEAARRSGSGPLEGKPERRGGGDPGLAAERGHLRAALTECPCRAGAPHQPPAAFRVA